MAKRKYFLRLMNPPGRVEKAPVSNLHLIVDEWLKRGGPLAQQEMQIMETRRNGSNERAVAMPKVVRALERIRVSQN